MVQYNAYMAHLTATVRIVIGIGKILWKYVCLAVSVARCIYTLPKAKVRLEPFNTNGVRSIYRYKSLLDQWLGQSSQQHDSKERLHEAL
jgi:hypothetical protein